jgi:UDP-N-acetylmuramoyl-tripeptide--D-alanyl-D-alanine ligase
VATLAKAAIFMDGELRGPDVTFRGVSTDTRSIGPGELFVALQGPNFDGTAFIDQAASNQAAGAVVPRPVDTELPTIVVDNTIEALGALAAAWRNQMPATVVGVTGSNGKTTLKELVASCLSMQARTLATHGNLNNQIGLPLMLLRMSPEDRYAVIEMGANHAGEIGYLTSLARPHVAAITNAAPAHLEGFGSVEGVAHAKGEIFSGPESPAYAVLNADDDYFDYVRASHIEFTETGSNFILHTPATQFAVELSLEGRHNVLNACAATALATALDIGTEQIRRGLEAVRPVHGRLEPVRSISGATLYDDSYNANPVSVQAAAEFLTTRPGRSWFVLGDMAELGGDAELLHAHTGWVIREAGVQNLYATGPLSKGAVESFGDKGRWFATIDELIAELGAAVGEGDVVLVKGSRSSGMERVVEGLMTASGEGN